MPANSSASGRSGDHDQRRRELIALQPDCVVYAQRPERDAAAVPDYVKLLEPYQRRHHHGESADLSPTFEPESWREQLTGRPPRAGITVCQRIGTGFAQTIWC